MRIAKFGTGTMLISWTNLAVADTLRNLGHEVFEGVIPCNEYGTVLHHLNPHHYHRVLSKMPTLEQLQSCDVILVTGPEYIDAWIHMLYGLEAWTKLKGVKVAFYLESSTRQDYHFPYQHYLRWFDVHFFPDPRDAERFGGRHIHTCVDTEMFKPCDLHGLPGEVCGPECYARRMKEKIYGPAFVGSLYAARKLYLTRLLPLIQDLDFRAGAIAARDLDGEVHEDWVRLMVKNLRQIKVHVGLPSNNVTMMTARPFETMACGTFMLTYKTTDNLFQDGVHLRTYNQDKPEELAELIRYYLDHEDERERIAAAGLAEVRRNYSLKQRMQEVLELVRPGSMAGVGQNQLLAHSA